MERERVNHRSTRFMLECQHNHQPIPHLFQQTSGVMVPDLSTLLIFFLAWFRGLQLTHVSLHCSCPCLGTFPRRTAASHSEGFIAELGVAYVGMDRLPPRWTEPQGWGQASPTSHLSYFTISAPTQPLQAG